MLLSLGDAWATMPAVSSLLQEPTMDRLILLDETQATRAFLDSRNYRHLFRMLPLFTLIALLSILWLLSQRDYLQITAPVVCLLCIRALYASREHSGFATHFGRILVAFMSLQYAAFRLLLWEHVFHPLDFIVPLILLVFRLPSWGFALPLSLIWLSTTGRSLVTQLDSANHWQIVVLICQTAWLLFVFWLNDYWTGALRPQFVDDWRREHRRSKESRRLREEIGDAQRIQLSMLPRRPPSIPWLDLAGISIPANEVGGDYYNYFPLDEDRFVVVVADVAGHGVASGLVLSGIRSCLHLLLEDPPSPVTVLQKLDRVVRQTAGRRHFVTMIYALFDISKKQVTVAAAGHPPVLHFHQDSSAVDELGSPSLPLGTPLKGSFQQTTTSFDPADVFLLYTDGIAETCNDKIEAYGNERLGQRLATIGGPQHSGDHRSARDIRDTLLSDIVQFKGDCEQTDDITVVVLRVRPATSAS